MVLDKGSEYALRKHCSQQAVLLTAEQRKKIRKKERKEKEKKRKEKKRKEKKRKEKKRKDTKGNKRK